MAQVTSDNQDENKPAETGDANQEPSAQSEIDSASEFNSESVSESATEPATAPATEPATAPATEPTPAPPPFKSPVPTPLLFGIIFVLLCTVVVAVPMLMSSPPENEVDANTLGITGLHYAFLNEQYPVVTRVDEDSPAWISGITEEDQILAVDGMDASQLPDYDLFHALLGEPDKAVQVTIKSHGTGKTSTLSLYRYKAADLPRSEEVKYVVKYVAQNRLDCMKERDARATDGDYPFTSLLWYYLIRGPVVLEFFSSHEKPDAKLAAMIAEHNRHESSHSHITLLSIPDTDGKFRLLSQHFHVRARPVYVFIAGNRGVISSDSVFRGELGEELESRLNQMIEEGKQPIPDILVYPQMPMESGNNSKAHTKTK